MYLQNIHIFSGVLFSVGRGFFLALLAAGQTRYPSVRYNACLDSSQAPWRRCDPSTLLSWLFFLGVAFRLVEPSGCMEDLYISSLELVPPFQLATLPGYQVNRLPKLKQVVCKYDSDKL